jgi:four helix bundle protein
MNTIEKFEDLIAWQKARELTTTIYRTTRGAGFSNEPRLREQLQTIAMAMLSYIAKGYAAFNRTDFCRNLTSAGSACAQLQSELYIAVDCGCLPEKDRTALAARAVDVSKIVYGLKVSLSQRDEGRGGGEPGRSAGSGRPPGGPSPGPRPGRGA